MEEQRKHTRLDALNLIHFAIRDEGGEILKQGMGRTLNVSESGILLESHTPIGQSRQLSIAIGLEDRIAELDGVVVHCFEKESGVFEYGIEFGGTSSAQRDILQAYIDDFMRRK
jgi:hypothetical protein